MVQSQSTQVMALLRQLQRQLEQLGWWQQQPLAPTALTSNAPFCCDTMTFEQWLQFVLIPRLEQLISEAALMPMNAAMAPMAEYCWAQQPQAANLINLLQQLDEALSGCQGERN
ncbi:MAG: YqcC family protein [Ferrimonas sp.]